jgi:hypothetical protein
MPITIEVRQGGDTTAVLMLFATIGLFIAAGFQAFAALRQAGAAKRQAEAAEKQSKAADRQLYETVFSADKASMPVIEVRRRPHLAVPTVFRTVLKNDGVGPALHLQVLRSDGAVFVPGAPTRPIPPICRQMSRRLKPISQRRSYQKVAFLWLIAHPKGRGCEGISD